MEPNYENILSRVKEKKDAPYYDDVMNYVVKLSMSKNHAVRFTTKQLRRHASIDAMNRSAIIFLSLRLNELEAIGLIKKKGRGSYMITGHGKMVFSNLDRW